MQMVNDRDGTAKWAPAIALVLKAMFNGFTYKRKATRANSKKRPKLPVLFYIPC
jgi:hypothetical protein